MGAALHLAPAREIPAPKRKRKGGGSGGGTEFYDYAKRIYADGRADHESKEMLLALAYALTTPREDDVSVWTVARDALGADRIGRPRLNELISRDAPCYKSPVLYAHRRDVEQLFQRCSAPRIRPYPEPAAPEGMLNLFELAGQAPAVPPEPDFRNRLGVCGSDASDYAIERLPETGWHKVLWYCSRHRAELDRVKRQLKEPNALAPKPIPNWGGLLPSYFDSDWLRLYRFYCGEHWAPPVYGVRADDWPIPGKDPVPMRARLRLAALDGELLTGN